MKLTYDKSADAVYIYLVDNIGPGGIKDTYPLEPVEKVGQINFDFDTRGVLVGIEILGASKRLPADLINSAQIIG